MPCAHAHTRNTLWSDFHRSSLRRFKRSEGCPVSETFLERNRRAELREIERRHKDALETEKQSRRLAAQSGGNWEEDEDEIVDEY